MTKQQYFVLGCRVAAVYVLSQGLAALPQQIATVWSHNWSSDAYPWMIIIVSLAVLVVVARFLWYRSDWIVDKVFGRDALLEPEGNETHPIAAQTGIKLEDIEPIALGLIGVWVLSDAIPLLIYRILDLSRWTDILGGRTISQRYVTLVFPLLRVILGFALVFWNGSIMSIIDRLRLKAMPMREG